MAKEREWTWWLLLIPLVGFPALILWPGLGELEQGYWPEFFGHSMSREAAFPRVASQIRVWTAAALVVVFVVSAVCAWRLVADWRSRLRQYQVQGVVGYRTLAVRRAAIGAVIGVLLTIVLMVPAGSASWHLPEIDWVWLMVLAAGYACATFYAVSVLPRPWRRLLRGR